MEYAIKVTTSKGEQSCVFIYLNDALEYIRERCKAVGTTATLEVRQATTYEIPRKLWTGSSNE